MYSDSFYRNYRTRTFSEIFPDLSDFVDFYEDCGLPTTLNEAKFSGSTEDYVQTLYYLLLSRYANDHIASSDENRFRLRVMSTIYQYGGAWVKRMELRDKVFTAQLDELRKGTKAIYNTALNPETDPSTGSLEELTYINQQNTTNYGKGLLETMAQFDEVIQYDVTGIFLDRFKKLFTILPAEQPLWYINKQEEDENNDYYPD